MKHIFYPLFTGLFTIVSGLTVCAQHTYDTVKVMSYNTLNYGFPATESCPALITANKHGWLRTVLEYAEPDILGLEKMDASPSSFTSDTVIDEVLDSVCAGCYSHTPYTNNSGYDKENMLYYKTGKFVWVSTTTIYSADTNISDINLHRLYYNSPSLATTHDTAFLNIILVHLESGSSSTGERATEMTGAMNWLNAHVTSPGNYIFMGDFNTQSSTESCYQQMINSSNANTKFYDVENQLGNWDGDPSAFADYLTQSTRTSDPGDCGAIGGIDDWFDHLLCTDSIMTGNGEVTYVPNSFSVIGQDGQHVNKSLLSSPVNTSVPANVLNALYYMSEHLPVIMQLAIDTGYGQPASIPAVADMQAMQWRYSSLVNNQLWVKSLNPSSGEPGGAYYTRICDLSGRLLITAPLNTSAENYIPLPQLANGLYLLQIFRGNDMLLAGKFVKMVP